jgi:hypothetical protein
MAASYSFHPEALFEYAEATNYFLREASVRFADSTPSHAHKKIIDLCPAR